MIETSLEVFERDVKGTVALIKGGLARNDKTWIDLEIVNLKQTLAMAKFQHIIPKSYKVRIGKIVVK